MVGRYHPDLHRRRSIRLRGYDYAQAGVYFLTLCAHDRMCLFGDIEDGEMVLNAFGKIVREEWLKTPEIRSEIQLGEYVIMPNHFHGIVYIVTDHGRGDPAVRGTGDRPVAPASDHRPMDAKAAPVGPKPKLLGALVAGFKSAVTKGINEMRQASGGGVWQRNYYEHVIRNEEDYLRIAEYVNQNPQKWELDSLHPAYVGGDRVGRVGTTGLRRSSRPTRRDGDE